MILQALVRHYEDLAARNMIAPPGWNQVKVSYALELDEQGALLRAASIQENVVKGSKTVLIPRLMELPAPVRRTAGVSANFLCDNAAYILGLDGKGNAERARERFDACKALHERLLSGVDTPAAKALLAFFRFWDPEQAAGHPAIQDDLSGIMAGANLIFRFQGAFIHEDPAVRQAWQDYYGGDSGGPTMVCLITGRETTVEAVHPAVKGGQGAQSSGAALVSFNAPAFCSYGKGQGLNATIKDRYFNAASATPGHVFPILLNLSQKHLRKLEGGRRVYYEKQILELAGVLPEMFPPRLNLPQQGSFQLGYFHQTEKRYEKKEESPNA